MDLLGNIPLFEMKDISRKHWHFVMGKGSKMIINKSTDTKKDFCLLCCTDLGDIKGEEDWGILCIIMWKSNTIGSWMWSIKVIIQTWQTSKIWRWLQKKINYMDKPSLIWIWERFDHSKLWKMLDLKCCELCLLRQQFKVSSRTKTRI